MDLGPRLDQPLLGAWKLATNAFNWVHRKRRQGVRVESVKMWPVMRCTHLRKHTDDDSEEPLEISGIQCVSSRYRFRGLTSALSRAAPASPRRRRLQREVRRRLPRSSLRSTPHLALDGGG